MRYQSGGNQGEDDKPEISDEPGKPEIQDEDLDRVSGGGNSAWGTVQQGPLNGGSLP